MRCTFLATIKSLKDDDDLDGLTVPQSYLVNTKNDSVLGNFLMAVCKTNEQGNQRFDHNHLFLLDVI